MSIEIVRFVGECRDELFVASVFNRVIIELNVGLVPTRVHLQSKMPYVWIVENQDTLVVNRIDGFMVFRVCLVSIVGLEDIQDTIVADPISKCCISIRN